MTSHTPSQARLTAGGFSIGIEAPLDNDWTAVGEQARHPARHRRRGVANLRAYPGTPADHMRRVAAWRAVAGAKLYASVIHLDLAENADEPMQRWRFGFRGGREALIAELHALRAAGVDHVGLHFRHNQRPLDDTFHEIAEHVLPLFHSTFTQEQPNGQSEAAVCGA